METESVIDRFNAWLRESVIVKLFSIGFLVLILLIPSSWIQSIMHERQARAEEVMTEVSSRWSGSQTIAGPVLVIPYTRIEKETFKESEVRYRELKETAYFLPSSLVIKGNLDPQVLHRGIFDVAVYASALSVQAEFSDPDFVSLGIDPQRVIWKEARLAVGISDLRGISETPKVNVGENSISVEPNNDIGYAYDQQSNYGDQARLHTAGVEAPLGWLAATDFQKSVNIALALKGSTTIRFLPLGKTTDLTLLGPWTDPSFEGEFLPTTRTISEEGFEATWKVLHFNRPYAQQWAGAGKTLESYDLSTRLIIPADQYQKSIRTAKYGILLVLLSFTALLLVEIVRKIRIHPFQYILIGAALIVYYAVLLSLSEHIGFNLAYLSATLATVVLLFLYSRTFLSELSIQMLLAGNIGFFYLFVFVIIQAQDFSLLIGSVGLFIVVAALMYFSRTVNWYGDISEKSIVHGR